MSGSQRAQDLRKIMVGLLKVVNANVSGQQARCETIVKNSSVIKAAQEAPEYFKSGFPNNIGDLAQRASMVPKGVQVFLETAPKHIRRTGESSDQQFTADSHHHQRETDFSNEIVTIREEDLEDIYMKSLGVEVLQQNEDGKRYAKDFKSEGEQEHSWPIEKPLTPLMNPDIAKRIADTVMNSVKLSGTSSKERPVEPTASHSLQTDRRQSGTGGGNERLDRLLETIAPPTTFQVHKTSLNNIPVQNIQVKQNPSVAKPLSRKKPTSQLSASSKQRKVPASRIGRLVSFGGLAAGLGIGTLTEMTKRSLGLSDPKKSKSLLESSPFLTEANAERIVDTLCRVRGAALKIGQILSIQDNSMINSELQKVFERVRHSADFMPGWQMEKMMVNELGVDWKSNLLEFDDKPFAAASIGQVHLGKLKDGRPVAIKIQYPGVAEGIESDIDNLMSVLNIWSILPDGIFIDKVVEVAKRELSWEVDYKREAECAKRFRKLLDNHPDYYVPEVIDEFSTKQVYTTELIEGVPVDSCEKLDQESRDRICFLMLDLFFRELFEFQFMQTDPNWSNFLYNLETKQIGLIDFGASREYRNGFVDNYMKILDGASEGNKEIVVNASRDIGFLTGYESKAMENAHVEAVMILGEALRIGHEKYDFGSQHLTTKIQRLVPIMVRERLCPPPEEIYSLHRKLSGVFLLCSRLKGKVQCRPIFERVKAMYVPGRPDK